MRRTIPCVLLAMAVTAPPAHGAEGIHKIEHVVTIMQENRSFDQYFGTYPGAAGFPPGVCVPDPVNGGCQRPFHDHTVVNNGGPHSAKNAAGDIAGGEMNGFVDQIEKAKGCQPGETRCLSCAVAPGAEQCIDVMSYRDAREIPNYWEYASHFALQDNMFESEASWSLPEHLALVSAWSAICPTGDSNPLDCASSLYDISNTNKNVTVKARWSDITYLLHRAGVSWRYYLVKGIIPDCEFDEAVECKESTRQTPTTSGNWNPLRDFADVGSDGELGNIQSLNRFYEAVHATSCGLPNVSWVVPNQEVSEHPRASIKRGQAYVTTLINAIMRSPCWSSTAIFLSWDDWGGFYDSVPPPVIDENGYGLRVPGLVISPYARAGYIDHQLLSHDAYLKFIEDDFLGGQRLDPATDGRPDSRPNVREANPELGDLAAAFDFTQEPQPPLILSTHPAPGPASEPPK